MGALITQTATQISWRVWQQHCLAVIGIIARLECEKQKRSECGETRTGDLEAAPWMMYVSNGGGGRGLQWGKRGWGGIVGGQLADKNVCLLSPLCIWKAYAVSVTDSVRLFFVGFTKVCWSGEEERDTEREGKRRMYVINAQIQEHVGVFVWGSLR